MELRPANPQCKSHRLSTGTNPNASLFYIQNSDQRPQRYLPVVLTISPGSLVLVAITILKISLISDDIMISDDIKISDDIMNSA